MGAIDFHSQLELLVKNPGWSRIANRSNGHQKVSAIQQIAGVIFNSPYVDPIYSMKQLQVEIHRWIVNNAEKFNTDDLKRISYLRNHYLRIGSASEEQQFLEFFSDESSIAPFTQLPGSLIDPFQNYQNTCLSFGIREESISHLLLIKLFGQCKTVRQKKELSKSILSGKKEHHRALQKLFFEQFKNLGIDDEEVCLTLANQVYLHRPDLFGHFLKGMNEIDRCRLALKLFSSDVIIQVLEQLNLESDMTKMILALEIAMIDDKFAIKNLKCFQITDEEDLADLQKFLLAKSDCKRVFCLQEDPLSPRYQDELVRWINFDFTPRFEFPVQLRNKWKQGVDYLLQTPLDPMEAKKIRDWTLSRLYRKS